MSNQVMGTLLAGLIAGAAAALATTAIALIALVRSAQSGWVARLPGWERVRPPLLGVLLVNLLMLVWTGLGLIFAALYLRTRADHPGGGLGTPNAQFTLLVAGGSAVAVVLAAFVARRLAWPVWATGLVAVVAFGFLLPNLAR